MKKWQKLLSSKGAVLAVAASFVVVLLPVLAVNRWG